MKKYDVLIIGSGPAGGTVSIYTARNGFETAMFTGQNVGGQLVSTTEVENFPAFPEAIRGSELADRILKQSKNMGVDIIQSVIEGIDFFSRPFTCKTIDRDTCYAKNIVIATGAIPKQLGVEGERRFTGFGVSTCAICDGNFFKDQPVAVIGGGETAGMEALHMAHLASKVYLIHKKDKITKMQRTTISRIESDNRIEIILDSDVQEICGTSEPRAVESVKLFSRKIGGIVREIGVKAVFVAVGVKPQSDIFIDTGLNMDANGYIITEHDSSRTNIKNVYAVGDVTNKKYKQAIIAAGYGAVTALEIEEDNHNEF
ncbi:MAG: NAD(P)/FAD-dependent oxidoreductase [Rickettsiales bacterium]|jgi:thioredoxin reductase (NADPH)|nr:NAD(P)/FAD-dependent oxidoreductase [Rickettsiales bacterium]